MSTTRGVNSPPRSGAGPVGSEPPVAPAAAPRADGVKSSSAPVSAPLADGLSAPPPSSGAAETTPRSGGDDGGFLDDVLGGIRSVVNSDKLRAAAETALGPSSFAAGVLVGMAKNPIDDVVGLLELQKTFVLADLYDRVTEPMSWKSALSSVLSGPGGIVQAGAAALFSVGALDLEDLRAAHDQREAMKRELKEIFKNPLEYLGELPGQIRDEYAAKWQRFQELSRKSDLASQYEAGKILGDLVMDVGTTIAGFASGAGAAAKLAAKAPKLAKLGKLLGAGDDVPGVPGKHTPDVKTPGAKKADGPEGADAKRLDGAAAAAIDRKKITELSLAGKLDEARALLRPHLEAAKAATTVADKRAAMDELISRLDFTTDKAKMFWSGNKDVASELAQKTGKTVLEGTPGGKLVDGWDELNRVFAWQDGIEPRGPDFWGKVSKQYASDVRGRVEIVQSPDRFPQGGVTWRDHEWPAVRERAMRGEVTDLVIHRLDDQGNVAESLRLDPLSPETNRMFGGRE